MQDYTITQIHVQDITGTDANLQPTVTKRVTFYVGKQGPFVRNYSVHDYTPEKVSADMAAEADTLKQICEQAAMPH